ncbi:MAG: hypothetical protein ACM33T_04975 [Solirubrobacterales bacterium]
MRKLSFALAALLTAAPALGQEHDHGAAPQSAATGWTSLPLVQATLKGRGGAELVTANSAAREIAIVPPKGTAVTLAVADGKATFKPQIGNYHLVSAVDSCDTHVATASTAVYFSNPGPAPTEILRQPAAGLSVVPERLPREHGAFRAGETWRFLVSMDGKPLSGATVRVETGNGSKAQLLSDAAGLVNVTFPDDFPPRDRRPPETHGRPTQAPFVVAAVMQSGELQHIGAFNYAYRPGADDGMSLWAGAGFAFVGMVIAAPLVRRRNKGGAR